MPRRRTALLPASRRALATASLVAAAPLAVPAAGCGGSGDGYVDKLRPPTPVMISALIDRDHVRVSPASVGAGPLVVLVSNQSGRARRVTFAPADRIRGRRTSTSIGPGDTGRLQARPHRGHYRLTVGGRRVSPAAITVGAERPSAQDQLLRP